jgi:myo-inositol-1(or 4)-monophosphatase
MNQDYIKLSSTFEHLTPKIIDIVVESSNILKNSSVAEMDDKLNVSTNIDIEINQFLETNLKKVLDIPYISEENQNNHFEDSELYWVVDPVDGTLNLLRNHPDVIISVALVESKSLQPLFSVLVSPLNDLLFTAQYGKGAFCNGKRLDINRSNSNLKFTSFGLPYDAHEHSKELSTLMQQLIKNKWLTRQSGSAALDICRVGLGNWGAFYEPGIFLWDVIGADLIATESGCISAWRPTLINDKNEKYRIDYIVAENEYLVNELNTFSLNGPINK